MKDDIKEINIPENVLVALGDLTNGALNYYKATETVKVRHNTILDYITNLQEGNHNLLEEIEYMQNKNNRLIEENEKLKDDKDGWHLVAQRNYNELLDRIDKAIEYIEENCGADNRLQLKIILQGEEKMKDLDKKKLLNILIKKLDDNIGMYDYYSEEGHILFKIEQILNIIKVMNDEIPFEDWYLEDLLQGEDKE